MIRAVHAAPYSRIRIAGSAPDQVNLEITLLELKGQTESRPLRGVRLTAIGVGMGDLRMQDEYRRVQKELFTHSVAPCHEDRASGIPRTVHADERLVKPIEI